MPDASVTTQSNMPNLTATYYGERAKDALSRRKGPRVKSRNKSKRAGKAQVKVKIKGTASDVQKAAQALGGK